MPKVDYEKIRKLVAEIFVREGVPAADAGVVSDALLDANITGRASHGVLRTKNYVDRLEAGGANPVPNIRILRESETTALLDGDNGLGMVVSHTHCS